MSPTRTDTVPEILEVVVERNRLELFVSNFVTRRYACFLVSLQGTRVDERSVWNQGFSLRPRLRLSLVVQILGFKSRSEFPMFCLRLTVLSL